MAILPVNIDMEDWVDALRLEYSNVDIPLLLDKNDWKNWVDMLRLTSSFVDSDIPQSQGFNDFRDWAYRFIGNIGC